MREGQASVYAIYPPRGVTLLWEALQFRHASVIKLLLQAGADPFATVNRGRSAVAFQFFITGTRSAEDRELANLFPISHYIQELDLPPLHLSLLEITHVDLSKGLQAPIYANDINRRVGEGYNPPSSRRDAR